MGDTLDRLTSMATESLKNVVVEPDVCTVCRDRYTAIVRKKASCKFCHASACSKCIEQYLLTRHEDAHCLHCRVNYNDTTLHEICTKTYLSNTYFKHRQEVLINREKANLPALQDAAKDEKRRRDVTQLIHSVQTDINNLKKQKDEFNMLYNQLYVAYYTGTGVRDPAKLQEMNLMMHRIEEMHERIREKKDLHLAIRWAPQQEEKKEEEEKKKFIRRCTRDGCQGFLSTAWKCGMCEWYSCSRCFAIKGATHDVEHECKKEDLETAELIKKDCKPCPKCGEFIEKSSGCDQMFCITCQTPFSWNTGKIVTSGPIHNPHYYEWMKRTGGAMPRNPADVPCGGFPGGWELIRFPTGMKRNIANLFYEFHRICNELQDISTRQFRSHMDQTALNQLHIRFLLTELDEKKWGQQLALLEKKRKRDAEIQEILGAFRMVAVELINRVQRYSDGKITSFTMLPAPKAEEFIVELNVQIQELLKMINDALQAISTARSYSVPYIHVHQEDPANQTRYYQVRYKNFATELRKKKEDAEETE